MLISSFSTAKCLLAVISSACSLEAVKFDCTFKMITPWNSVIPSRYACAAKVINSCSDSLDSVTGVHESGKSNEEVKYLYIYRQHMPLVPEGMSDFSENLDAS